MSLPRQVEDESVIAVLGTDCSIIVQHSSTNSLVFTQIPSPTRNIPQKTWTIDSFAFDASSFALDERQNLLIVAEKV